MSSTRPSIGFDEHVELTYAEKEHRNASGKLWSMSNGQYVACESTATQLEAGQYTIAFDNQGIPIFTKKEVNLDELIVLPDNNSDKVVNSINDFWTKEDKFRELGFLWKRGILLYGPPGSGKTSTVQQLSKQIIDQDGVAIYCTSPHVDSVGLSVLRKIEPTRPIVLIIEDIDSIVCNYGESDLLALLDGELQIDNIVTVATTNYPEKLDKRLINRPSRFDEVIHIGMPNDECRRVYLEHKCPRLKEDEAELMLWVDKTHEFSIAHLKELIVSVECLGHNRDTAIERLRTMIDTRVTSDVPTGKFGFS